MVNKAILLGNVCAQPEKRSIANGTTVTTFTVACTERYKDKNGQQQEQTEFLRCVAWSKLGDICADFLDKGSKVYCEGKNTIRQWDDSDGNKRYSHEIILREMKMLSPKSENSGGNSHGGYGESTGNDDSMPF